MNKSTFRRPMDLDNRTTFWRSVIWFIEAFAWDWLYWKPFRAMRLGNASNIGGRLFRFIGPLTSTHKTVKRNLRLAFPDWVEAKIEKVALNVWENIGFIAGELPHIQDMDMHGPKAQIDVEGMKWLNKINATGKGAVLISAHLANWEVGCAFLAQMVENLHVTYRPANNPYIDYRISRARLANGVKTFAPKGMGARHLMKALTKGEPVVLMNDQKFNRGLAIPFFGKEAMTADGPTRLAMRFNVPLIFVGTERLAYQRFKMTIYEPFDLTRGASEEERLENTLLQINQLIESLVRVKPEEWFWMHRRWPKSAWSKSV